MELKAVSILCVLALIAGLVCFGWLVRKHHNGAFAKRSALLIAITGFTTGIGATGAAWATWAPDGEAHAPSPDRAVFLDVPLPRDEPPGLVSVRFTDSPTNGLELYFQQGQEVFMACVAVPEQLATGSCRSAEASAIRSDKTDDGRVLLISRLSVLGEERAKTPPTVPATRAAAYWHQAPLQKSPDWLKKWM